MLFSIPVAKMKLAMRPSLGDAQPPLTRARARLQCANDREKDGEPVKLHRAVSDGSEEAGPGRPC